MARRGKVGCKTRRRVRSEHKGSDESDEDYIVDEDKEVDESDDGYSFLGDESEESLGEYEGEEEEEMETKKVKRVVRSRAPRIKKSDIAKPRKRKRISYREDDEDEDGEGEDEDDVEFSPGGSDGTDDEDELLVKKGMRNLSKPRKATAKVRKRRRNQKVWKKITTKKPQKKRRLKRKARSDYDDEDFVDFNPVVEEKNKRNAGQGRTRKRLRVDSDSDFVSSGPSDYELTISEEEREQIREASEFCRGVTTSWRGSASLQSLPKEEAPRRQRKRLGRKDKEKVEELKTEAGKQICGICLSEEGTNTVRGTLNCCSHFFCFACIMEWSKVESRCPLCKQRFVSISQPARSNSAFDLRTVVIQVPQRDQVYQPSEEELRGYIDPYENVLCTECQQGGDDALMLLCDLCDSPAHTYCVGLGHEVPEGNWYCEGCRPTALVSSNPQNLNPTSDNRTSNNFSVGSPPEANVRGGFDLNEIYVPDTPLTQGSGDFQSPRDGQVSSLTSGAGALTVSDRRRIQRQIHQLLNNRRRQLNRSTGNSVAVSGNSLFGSQIGQSRELATQPAVTQRAASPHNNHLSHYGNVLPERPRYSSGQVNLDRASTSAQSSIGGFSQFAGTDPSISLGLVHQQVHPCNSRSNIGTVHDSSTSPCPSRETTVPSSTLPGSLRRPF